MASTDFGDTDLWRIFLVKSVLEYLDLSAGIYLADPVHLFHKVICRLIFPCGFRISRGSVLVYLWGDFPLGDKSVPNISVASLLA